MSYKRNQTRYKVLKRKEKIFESVLSKYGISITYANKRYKPMDAILFELSRVWDTVTEEDRYKLMHM